MSTAINPYDKNILECVAWNMLLYPCHERARRDHDELPTEQQKQIWSDLTGSEAKKRVFQNGREFFSEGTDSPFFINDCLSKLQEELDKIEDKPAYNTALQNSPRHVKSYDFRLKFLRAEQFDCRAAAERMVVHFREKLELFGPEKLGRDNTVYL